jgi:hypothetical protein
VLGWPLDGGVLRLTSKLSKGVDREQQHHPDDDEIDYQRGRTTTAQSTTRTNEQTSSDGTTDGNHLHVSTLQTSLQSTLTQLDILNGRRVTGGPVVRIGRILLAVADAHLDFCMSTRLGKKLMDLTRDGEEGSGSFKEGTRLLPIEGELDGGGSLVL